MKTCAAAAAAKSPCRSNAATIPAQHLYETLGYATLGTMTTWRLTTSRAQDFAPREPAGEGDDVPVRELPPELWRAAFAVDQLALSPAMGWPEPLRPDAYRRGILQRLNNFTSGRKAQTWATLDEKGRLTASPPAAANGAARTN